jgi:hypothetical protein
MHRASASAGSVVAADDRAEDPHAASAIPQLEMSMAMAR